MAPPGGAEVAIDATELIDGWLPPRALRLVLEWGGGHRAELRANWDRGPFDDGSKRVVDLGDELWGPMGEPLRDPAYFRQVRVDPELRTVVWPNGFDLDPDVLHGRPSQEAPPAATHQPAA